MLRYSINQIAPLGKGPPGAGHHPLWTPGSGSVTRPGTQAFRPRGTGSSMDTCFRYAW